MQKATSFRTRSSRRGSVSPQAGNLDRLASRRSFMMPDESSRRESRLKDDFDHVSETSSMEERRYADLLGSDSDSDNGGGIAIDNIGHRLYITGTSREKAKQDRLQQLRERILLKELNEVTTKPSVTNHARCKPAKGAMFAEHAIAWQERRQEKLEESARKVREEEDRGMMASPHINRHSADLAASRGYQGPVSGWEDHFAKYCAKKAAQQNQAHPPGMFTPNINRSAHLDDSRAQESISIGDRLFEDSYAREDRLRELEEIRRERELVDEFTNRPLFEPSRVEYPLPEGRDLYSTPEASGARMHALHAEMLERKRIAQSQTADTSCRFSPKVNKKSLQIGDRRRKPLHHNKVDYHKQQLEAEDRDKALGLSTHNRPTTPRSGGGGHAAEIRQKPTPNARDFVYRNEKLNIQRHVRLAKIKEEAMEHQSRECTFQPSVNRRSMELFHAINQYGTELLEAPSLKYQSGASAIAPNTGVNTSLLNRSASGMLNATNNNNSGINPAFGFGSPLPKQQYADPYVLHQQQQQTPGRSPSSIQRGTPGKSLPQQQQHHPTATSDRYNLSGPPPHNQQHNSASANRGRSARGASPAAEVAAQKSELNEYVQSFEKQMFQVLDEWRRLEDV